jgi:hypothetical protein
MPTKISVKSTTARPPAVRIGLAAPSNPRRRSVGRATSAPRTYGLTLEQHVAELDLQPIAFELHAIIGSVRQARFAAGHKGVAPPAQGRGRDAEVGLYHLAILAPEEPQHRRRLALTGHPPTAPGCHSARLWRSLRVTRPLYRAPVLRSSCTLSRGKRPLAKCLRQPWGGVQSPTPAVASEMAYKAAREFGSGLARLGSIKPIESKRHNSVAERDIFHGRYLPRGPQFILPFR